MTIYKSKDNSKTATRYKNAVVRRYHNKRVVIAKEREGYLIEITNLGNNHALEPSSKHINLKDKIGINQLLISKETLEAIILNGVDILADEKP